MLFAGKSVIVTGSAGSIGGAIASAFAAEGADLGLIDLKPSQATRDAILAFGRKAIDQPADVADRGQVIRSVSAITENLGGVDILVNASGITSFGSAATLDEAEWDRVLAINLKGVFLCCQAVIGPMRKKDAGGRIINIGSLLGKNGGNARPWLDPTEQTGSGNVAYGVSKAGVHAMTVYLARELASAKITVNAVAPGPIVSPMTQAFPERMKSLIPLGRMGTPEEVAAAVLFLAGDKAGFITGEILDVNGGTWAD